ncbi:uncharacterized protein LOC118349712 [Juglans regia]|uniref:Uncharacterized protein LOC118349712 n=1 Tax=Juglans regia TaxID=51240 RepID=A0A6P9EU14_JUGRE|nr:uncharacterized protein LOC118349712 [Juglans regia]
MAIKLDMSKAYDRVEWPFLEAMLKRLGFGLKMCSLIMKCISSVSYSVLVNGKVGRSFLPSRGIRQGDLLSPYLFIICAEGLSQLLLNSEREGAIRGTAISRGGIRVNHLLFADDCVLFCRALKREWKVIYSILEMYEKASGQAPNKQKTSIFFSSNTTKVVKRMLFQEAGAVLCDSYERYLGLPAVVGRSRYNAFRSIKEKVWLKMQNWKSAFLSKADKEVLIKAVLQAIPTYTMSIFQLPKRLCRDIEALMSKFWWSNCQKERGIHWKRWSWLGMAKAEGGLGFRNLESFNRAMLAKQGWRILKEPLSLVARVFKDKYFKNMQFLEAPLGRLPSLIWKSIWSAMGLVKEGMLWRIGNGKSVNIWGQKWLPTQTTHCVQSEIKVLNPNAKVSELIEEQEGRWKEDVVANIFNKEEAKVICAIPVSRFGSADKLIWGPSKNGKFSVKSAYFVEQKKYVESGPSHVKEEVDIWKRIWSLDVPGVAKHFMWRAGIWHRRNKVVFENKFVSPGTVVQLAIGGLDEFHVANQIKGVNQKHTAEGGRGENWKRPNGQWFKANFDGALNMEMQKMGMGIVVRDSKGEVIASLCGTKGSVTSPFIAELNALWRTMDFCSELGLQDVIIEGDAKELIDAINTETEDESWKGQLVEDMKQKWKNRKQWDLKFIYREGNVVAHHLAKLALQLDDEVCWIENVPKNVNCLVQRDKDCSENNMMK